VLLFYPHGEGIGQLFILLGLGGRLSMDKLEKMTGNEKKKGKEERELVRRRIWRQILLPLFEKTVLETT
jgi:hypothetical protein